MIKFLVVVGIIAIAVGVSVWIAFGIVLWLLWKGVRS